MTTSLHLSTLSLADLKIAFFAYQAIDEGMTSARLAIPHGTVAHLLDGEIERALDAMAMLADEARARSPVTLLDRADQMAILGAWSSRDNGWPLVHGGPDVVEITNDGALLRSSRA